MPTTTTTRPKMHGLIAGAALAWNLMGLLMFVLQITMVPARLAGLSPADRAVYEATPGWVNAAYGVAVAAGLLGSVGLLVGRRWAASAYAVSLVALLVQFAGAFAATPAWESYGAVGLAMPVMLVVITLLLLRYAQRTS